ncbi:hypothetical protein [Bradyrhizobium sp. Arg816]|uniref:hypothetical protein n=1 Tax=Bradyrhizobium sp. Arg816 TaxID=2998491 RepID=UPI00249DC5CA|nr:hypothetical protein [Bradyrhizobium sp. Arg816]MDI3562538.1 hypothetical protein [Bradyrhizobium sp. Arg816]
MNNALLVKAKPYLIWAIVIALGYLALEVASYWFAVPNGCVCLAEIKPELANMSLIHNSVGDASKIIIKTYGFGEDGGITLCYRQKPRRGNIDGDFGLPEKGCEFSSTYSMDQVDDAKTDTKNSIRYKVIESTLPEVPPGIDDKSLKETIKRREQAEATATGARLDLDRTTNMCTFQATEWNGTVAVGNMNCSDQTFHFNIKAWQNYTQLFYTRIFYYLNASK